jgi:hypothetical protein
VLDTVGVQVTCAAPDPLVHSIVSPALIVRPHFVQVPLNFAVIVMVLSSPEWL